MAAARDGFGILYEKLQIDHPVVQRHAVIAIFERFKASCTGRLQSGLAQGAIAHCFSSLHPAVIDQTVKEVCKLVKEQILSMERGLQELQAALDSVAGDRVGVIITGIGFLCRIAVDEAVAGKDMQKWAMILQANPLVKALVSREEAHFEILQQLSIIILHAHSATPRLQIAMEFLRSFFNLILIRPLLSCGQVLFARQLHSHLSLLACAYPTVGLQLLKMLIEYTEYYPIQSVQEIDMKAAAVRDLVDILESLLKNPQAQRQEAVQYGYSLLFCLLGLCHELKAHALPSLPALLLFKRAQKLLQSYKTGMPESCDVLLVSLAHILAATQVEQEQLLIIDLIISWFTGCNSKDSFLNTGSAQNFPSVLAFVYPALQLISLPSPQLKSAAIGLLQIIEDFTPICTPRVSLHCEKAFFASLAVQKELQMAGVVHYLLCSLWSQEKLGTWLTVDNFLLGKLPETPDNMNCTWCWLRNLRLQLSAGRESASNLIWDFKAEKNKGFVLWTSIIAATLLCHPSPEVSIGAADIVAAICTAKPIMGLSLFPVILFSFKNKIKGRSSKNGAILLALLNILPTLANHATTLPLIVQVLEPMLQYKQDLMMQATGIRLLCKTWECSDRAFPSLEKALQPSKFLDKTLDLHLAVSIAVSLRDVCKNNSDRGTDLVLSIQACIESKISVVQALGLESLSYLCEDDTIDFYTTWLVISKLFQNLPTNPLMAKSLCMLLGHGSLDAVQHLEESQSILSILWQLATYKTEGDQRFDWKVRAAALKAIQEYEVEVMENVFPLHGKHVELLLSESSPEVQTVFKDIVIKYLIHEHRNRDRGQKERKHNLNRLEKLLEALPQVIFPTLKSSSFPDKAVAEFPGAALLLLDIPSHNLAVKTTLGYRNKAVKSRKDAYERMFSEIADQLNIKQNLITILLALESWYSFLPRWLKAEIASLEQQVLSDDPENFVIKAADNIMKILYKTIEEGIPRVAVNATLALAALCKALPSSAHSICKSMAEYLRSQLSVDEHEYIRWSSAISLGVVSTSLHATDQMLRSEIVKLLLGCAAKSESGIVRAGCAIALGSICQNLLKDSSITDISDVSDKSKDQEISLLMNIVKNLAQLLVEICPSCEQTLNSILNFKISKDEELCIEGQRKVITSRVEQEIEENVWAVVGLLIGLGLSVTAIARAGKISLVLAITDAVIAWIPQKAEANLSVHSGSSYNYICSFSSLSLAVGACIALPMCVHVCYSLELMRDAEVDSLLGRLHLLLQDTWNLQSHSEIGIWMMQLSAAASIGTGNLFAFLLFEGSHPMQLEVVNSIMQTLLKGSKMSQATYGQLGSMVGLANALGAGAVLSPPLRNWSLEDKVGIFSEVETTDGLFVSNPLCLYGHCEGFLRSVVQDIIGLARGGQDLQVKSHAGWALGLFYKAFLRTHRFEQETGTGDGSAFLLKPQDLKVSTIQGYNMKSLESLPSGSTLSLLCSWLVKACSEEGNISRPKAILSVLRCLEKAPRLPAVDWGGLIRRLMRHDQYLVDSSATVLTLDMSNRLGEQQSIRIQVRQQCVSFSLAHAVQISSLALVLDELYDLSRLSTIELPLLLYLFEHVMLIERIFSEYRLKKLWEDLSSFLGSTQFQQLNNQLNAESKEKLRISMWKGLNKLVKNSQPHSGGLKLKRDFDFQNLKQLMKILIDYLPSSHLYGARGSSKKQELPHEEWKVAVDCLSQTPSEWLLQVFQVQAKDSYQTSKAILARARLVLKGCLHSNTLKTACTWLTSQRPSEIWTLLVEVTMALKQLTMEEKQEWIVNIMDTAMTCNYPLSAMQLLACFSSCWSSAAPLLVIDARIMETLPLCLPVFFLESSWQKNINVVFDKIISLTEIFAQRMSSRTSIPENIDTQVMDENKLTLKGLYLVAKRTSLALKEHLPHDMHTKVAHLNTI